jgi:hypothetical protein
MANIPPDQINPESDMEDKENQKPDEQSELDEAAEDGQDVVEHSEKDAKEEEVVRPKRRKPGKRTDLPAIRPEPSTGPMYDIKMP